MNGKEPNDRMNLKQNIFQFKENPDIIVISLQEMVKLNAKNVMIANNDKI